MRGLVSGRGVRCEELSCHCTADEEWSGGPGIIRKKKREGQRYLPVGVRKHVDSGHNTTNQREKTGQKRKIKLESMYLMATLCGTKKKNHGESPAW